MRKFGLILAALLVFAAAGVQAQIASPSLSIVLSGGNPAVLPLYSSSQIGVGTLDVEVGLTFGAFSDTLASGDGTAVDLRFVGESFAVSYGQTSIDLEVNPTYGGGTISFGGSAIEAGVRMGESFTLGVSQESEENSEPGESSETSLVLGGIVWKLGDAFYIGGSYGTETGNRNDPFNIDSEADHVVARYGVALYSRDGESGYHLEINREETGVLELKDPAGNTQYLESYEETGFVLEFLFSNIMIGFESIKSTGETADINNLFSVETVENKAQTITLGWVPEEGLNVLLFSSEEEEDDGAGTVVDFSLTGLFVSWAF